MSEQDAGLHDPRAREDVGHRDDLGGVLGVDHGRAARHRDHDPAVRKLIRQAQAEAWVTCIDEAEGCGWLHDFGADDLAQRNPYREETP